MKVSSTLLEQVSASCQLRFNKVFLRSLIGRLPASARPAERAWRDPSRSDPSIRMTLAAQFAAQHHARCCSQDASFASTATVTGLVLVVLDQRVGRVVVDRLEVLRFDHIGADALSSFRRTATSRTMSSTNFGLS